MKPKSTLAWMLTIALTGHASELLAAGAARDEFFWLGEINKASTVMLVEQGVVTRPLGRTIATAIDKVIKDGDAPAGPRPGVVQYLQLEQALVTAGGPEVTRVHSGRSRQDLLATVNRIFLRERSLDLATRLEDTRLRLLRLASNNIDVIIPAYTNGVQAQPISLGHYLLAFEAAIGRDEQRLMQSYGRVNRSPLGAAALGTSSFPIDRTRLADLLGFGGVIENSYDANLVAAMDGPLEVQQVALSAALTVGALMDDIVSQYRNTEPWLLLREGDLTGPSSIMPQKRNPYGLGDVRALASTVVGDVTAFVIDAHNVAPGMLDYKSGQTEKSLDDASKMLQRLGQVLDAIVVNRDRALAEVDADYSTTTELADVLQRESDIPFRIGHHFASELVTYGRSHKLKAKEIPFPEAQRIFAESAAAMKWPEQKLPLDERQFRRTLSAENMVASSKGLGGPQPAEVARMLAAQQTLLSSDQRWWAGERSKIAKASDSLQDAFGRLR